MILSRNEGHNNLKDMKKTDSGRVVFGGDGITPDEKYKVPDLTLLEAKLDSQGRLAYFLYAPEFFAHHDTHIAKDWKPDNQAMEEFRAFIAKKGVVFTAADFERDRPGFRSACANSYLLRLQQGRIRAHGVAERSGDSQSCGFLACFESVVGQSTRNGCAAVQEDHSRREADSRTGLPGCLWLY